MKVHFITYLFFLGCLIACTSESANYKQISTLRISVSAKTTNY